MAQANTLPDRRKPVNFHTFEELCQLQCTDVEIASALGVSLNTLKDQVKEWYDDTFRAVVDRFRGVGVASMRRAIWKNAIDNESVSSQIFWLKNYGDMSDNPNPTKEERATINIAVVPGMMQQGDWQEKMQELEASRQKRIAAAAEEYGLGDFIEAERVGAEESE